MNLCELLYKELQDKLSNSLKNIYDADKIKEITELFEKSNPTYKPLESEIKFLQEKVNLLTTKIYKRETVLKRLNLYKSLILKYAI